MQQPPAGKRKCNLHSPALLHRNIPKAEVEGVYLKIKIIFCQQIRQQPLDPLAVKSTIHEAMKEIFGMIYGSVPVDLIAVEKGEFVVRVLDRQMQRMLLAALFFRSSMLGVKCKFELVSSSCLLAFLQ